MSNRIEIPQYNTRIQDLSRPFQITDKDGNMYQITFNPSGGLTITKLSELSYKMEISFSAPNQILLT